MIFDELTFLENYFLEEQKRGRRMADLYKVSNMLAISFLDCTYSLLLEVPTLKQKKPQPNKYLMICLIWLKVRLSIQY